MYMYNLKSVVLYRFYKCIKHRVTTLDTLLWAHHCNKIRPLEVNETATFVLIVPIAYCRKEENNSSSLFARQYLTSSWEMLSNVFTFK